MNINENKNDSNIGNNQKHYNKCRNNMNSDTRDTYCSYFNCYLSKEDSTIPKSANMQVKKNNE